MSGLVTPQTPPLLDETDRARVMALYDLAGARREGALDDLAAFAAELCATPVALVSLVEEDVQTFLARAGTDLANTPRSQSFCAYAMHGHQVMQVPDATRDPRFADNPLVTGAPHIRFYAGAPLTLPSSLSLGTLCLIDRKPRTLDAMELGILRTLRDLVVLDLRTISEVADA